MNIAHALQWFLLHWKLWGIPSIAVGTAKAGKMWFDLRKAREEYRQVKRQSDLKDAVLILFRQAVAHPAPGRTGCAILPKSKWASFLPEPSMVDDALRELDAKPMPDLGVAAEYWMVELPQAVQSKRG